MNRVCVRHHGIVREEQKKVALLRGGLVRRRMRRLVRRAGACNSQTQQLVAPARNVARNLPDKGRHDDLEKLSHTHPESTHERVAAPVGRTHVHARQQIKLHRRLRKVPVQHSVVIGKRPAALGAVVAVHKGSRGLFSRVHRVVAIPPRPLPRCAPALLGAEVMGVVVTAFLVVVVVTTFLVVVVTFLGAVTATGPASLRAPASLSALASLSRLASLSALDAVHTNLLIHLAPGEMLVHRLQCSVKMLLERYRVSGRSQASRPRDFGR